MSEIIIHNRMRDDREAVGRAVKARGIGALPDILELYDKGFVQAHEFATERLLEFGPTIVPKLLDFMEQGDEYAEHRVPFAIEGIGPTWPEETISALLGRINNANIAVAKRCKFVRTMALMLRSLKDDTQGRNAKDKIAAELLRLFQQDPDPDVQETAMDRIAYFNGVFP